MTFRFGTTVAPAAICFLGALSTLEPLARDRPSPAAAAAHPYFDALVARADFFKGYSLRPKAGEPITSVHYGKQLLGPAEGGYRAGNTGRLIFLATTYDPQMDATKFRMPPFVSLGWKLAGAVDATATTIRVAPVTTQAEAQRHLRIGSEVMVVTDYADPTTGLVKVIRAQKGTAAASHPAGTPVEISYNSIDVGSNLRVPVNTTNGHKWLFTWDNYWTDSFVDSRSWQLSYKMFQFSAPSYDGTRSDSRSFLEIQARADVNTTPPYVPSDFNPKTDVSSLSFRSYSNRTPGPADWQRSTKFQVGPGVTSDNPMAPKVGTFIIKPNRWVRIWVLIDQRANDYDYASMWAADSDTGPVLIYDRIPLSIPPSSTVVEGIHKFWWEIDTSTSELRRNVIRDYVYYSRNFVVLKSPASLTELLVKPRAD